MGTVEPLVYGEGTWGEDYYSGGVNMNCVKQVSDMYNGYVAYLMGSVQQAILDGTVEGLVIASDLLGEAIAILKEEDKEED